MLVVDITIYTYFYTFYSLKNMKNMKFQNKYTNKSIYSIDLKLQYLIHTKHPIIHFLQTPTSPVTTIGHTNSLLSLYSLKPS